MLGVHPYTYMIEREARVYAGQRYYTVLLFHGDELIFRGRRTIDTLSEILEDPEKLDRFIKDQGLDMS